jgi:hypothetical protein
VVNLQSATAYGAEWCILLYMVDLVKLFVQSNESMMQLTRLAAFQGDG